MLISSDKDNDTFELDFTSEVVRRQLSRRIASTVHEDAQNASDNTQAREQYLHRNCERYRARDTEWLFQKRQDILEQDYSSRNDGFYPRQHLLQNCSGQHCHPSSQASSSVFG